MTSNLLVRLGAAFLVLASCLLFARVLVYPSNDGEIRRLQQGEPSSAATEAKWSAWRPNDGSVRAFSVRVPSPPGPVHPNLAPRRDAPKWLFPEPPTVSEFRVGVARGALFDFTLYEGRVAGAPATVVPASGPGWGASYHWAWCVATYLLAVVCLCVGLVGQRGLRPAPAA